MKKSSCYVGFLALLVAMPALAQGDRTLNGFGDSEQLGMMAGLALACNAGTRLDDYELIASRILANQAQTAAEEKKATKDFATAKFNAYKEQKDSPQASCPEVLDSFNHLPLFKSVVYADGVVKLPNGTFLKPRKGAVIPKMKAKTETQKPVKAPAKKIKKPKTQTEK